MPKSAQFILGFLLVIIVTASALYYSHRSNRPEAGNYYRNEEYGLAFHYPLGYFLREQTTEPAGQKQYQITILRTEDAAPREDSESPPAITLTLYPNVSQRLSLREWLNTPDANFKLAKGPYATTTLARTPALAYEWSGLYEAKTIITAYRRSILALTVTYIAPTDQILADYQKILTSLELF